MANHVPYIAFADDDPDDQEMLAERFLQHQPGVLFKFFKDGGELDHYLENCPPGELPSLLIVDYKMPFRTGIEVLKALYNDPRFDSIHKIVWSTSGNSEYIAQSLKYGADKYFTKPGNIQELDAMVAQLSHLFSAAPTARK